jgi:hypothetical protein
MKKLVYLIAIFLLSNSLNAKYFVYKDGAKIAEVEDLETIRQTYIRAKLTNPMYRLMAGGMPYVMYYHDVKPKFKDTKYRYDWQRYLTVLQILVEQRPADKELLVNRENPVFIKCTSYNRCEFQYFEKKNLFLDGEVIFDTNGKIYSITDKVHNAKIVKVSDVREEVATSLR